MKSSGYQTFLYLAILPIGYQNNDHTLQNACDSTINSTFVQLEPEYLVCRSLVAYNTSLFVPVKSRFSDYLGIIPQQSSYLEFFPVRNYLELKSEKSFNVVFHDHFML